MNLPLTKYEIARIIGTRATQISEGAKPLVDITGMIDPLKIAEKEYEQGKIPMSIIRKLPNGKTVKVDILPP